MDVDVDVNVATEEVTLEENVREDEEELKRHWLQMLGVPQAPVRSDAGAAAAAAGDVPVFMRAMYALYAAESGGDARRARAVRRAARDPTTAAAGEEAAAANEDRTVRALRPTLGTFALTSLSVGEVLGVELRMRIERKQTKKNNCKFCRN